MLKQGALPPNELIPSLEPYNFELLRFRLPACVESWLL